MIFKATIFSLIMVMVLMRIAIAQPAVIYNDVSSTHLPTNTLTGNSMDARPADLDGDGDLDIVVACEFCPNIILINDGSGHFSNESVARIPQPFHDSEDIAIADFDGDGDLDILFVSEDDQINEFYLNDGNGFFSDASSRIPVTGTSNSVLAVDVNNDSIPDVLIGNAGQNIALINDGNGFFTDETSTRIPNGIQTTQDLEWGDIDGDGDMDLLEGNENGNRMLLNDGNGVFSEAPPANFPLPASGEETREIDLGDVDGDGDLDLFLANVNFGTGSPAQNRLLLNDGSGIFTDVTTIHLPPAFQHTVDGDFYDLDLDGDLDIITAHAFGGLFQVLENDNSGIFTDASASFLFPLATGNGIDIEGADFNNDGILDLYFCGFQQTDKLYFGETTANGVIGIGNLVTGFSLAQNYPNPFNPETTIEFDIPQNANVRLKVYDLQGRLVTTLVDEKLGANQYKVTFDGQNLASGIYYYHLQMGQFSAVKRMVLIR